MGQDQLPELTAADVEAVTAQLQRTPQADFTVAARNAAGEPTVIRNAPFMHDGTPMPTTFWLTHPDLIAAVGRLEAAGGVKRAETEVDTDELAHAHAAYARERDEVVGNHEGPTPYGGVGGTRRGVKCLHAHYAYWLAGGDDPIGRWVDARIDA